MTKGERVKEVRKSLGFTLEKFGGKLGVSKQTVSRIENGVNNLTDQMLKSISREYGVSEAWLLDGTGEMFLNKDTSSLDAYIRSNNVSPLEAEILNAYFDLDPEIRRSALDHFRKRLGKYFANHPEHTVPDSPEELTGSSDPGETEDA